MSGSHLIISLLFSAVWIIHAFKDAEVSCVYKESCVLPCSVQGSLIEIIWLKIPEMIPVQWHSKDQTFHQHYSYRNRTFLFCDQLSQGNCSLHLTELNPKDNGRYECNTFSNSSRKYSSVNVKVSAPVETVKIERSGNDLVCSSEGVYPKPELSWTRSRSPLSLTNSPRVHQNKQQLYSIRSTLQLSQSDSQEYSCNVSTPYSWRRAIFTTAPPVTTSETETTLPCATSVSPIKRLVWTFNNTQTILNQSSETQAWEVSPMWNQRVKNVSESGSLTLMDLTPDQQGLYTCRLTTDKETYTINTQLEIQVFSGVVIGVMVTAVVIGTILVLYFTYKQDKNNHCASKPKEELPQTDPSVSSSSTPPQDQYYSVRVIFFILGLGSLLPWHFFVTASLYFKYRLNASNKTWSISLMTLISLLSQLLPVGLSCFFHLRFTLRKHITCSLVIIMLLFLLIAVLVKVPMTGDNFFCIAMGLIWFTMLFSAMFQCNLFGLVCLFPDIYRNTCTHGQAAAGTITALVLLVSIAITKDDDSAAFSHFLIAFFGTLITLLCYLFLPRLAFAQHFLNRSQTSKEDCSFQLLAVQTNEEQNGTTKPKKKETKKNGKKKNKKKTENKRSEQPKAHTSVFKKLKMILRAFCVGFVPTITLSVFPAVTADVQTFYPGKWERFFIPVCCFLIFNTCDWIGQITASCVCWSCKNLCFQVMFTVLVFIRAGFIPLLMFCNVQSRTVLPVAPLLSRDEVFVVIMALFSFSNGWLGSLSESYIPHQEEGRAEYTPKNLWVVIGMTLGAVLSFGFRAAI